MQETLLDHHTSISIGGRPIFNLRFADDIDLMAGSNNELQAPTNRPVDSAGAFGMEVSHEKSKVMVNTGDFYQVTLPSAAEAYIPAHNAEVDVMELVQSQLPRDQKSIMNFSSQTKPSQLSPHSRNGSSQLSPHSRIATAMAAIARLNRIWRSNNISLTT